MATSKKFNFSVTSLTDDKFKRQHTYGELARVEKWELQKVIHILHQLHPDSRNLNFFLNTIQSYYFEDDNTKDSAFLTAVAPWFPVVMNDFRGQRLSTKERACLWIVACYWHLYCGGPRVQPSLTVHKKVSTDEWKSSLYCPFCNTPYNPPAALSEKGQRAVLKAFGKWMSLHSADCGEKSPAAKKAIAEIEQGRTKIEVQRAKFEAQQVALAKMGDVGTEIIREMNRLKAQAEKLQVIESNRKYWQTLADSAHFKVLGEQAIKSVENPLPEPLSIKEQTRLATLVQACTRIQQLLDQIKGQRGVTAQRESLQKDLKALSKERDTLEARRVLGGELDMRMPRR